MAHTYNPRTFDTVPEIKTCIDEDKIGISVSGGKDKPVTFVENTGMKYYQASDSDQPSRRIYGSNEIFRNSDGNVMKINEVNAKTIMVLSPDNIHQHTESDIYYDPDTKKLYYGGVDDYNRPFANYFTVQGNIHVPTADEIKGDHYWIPLMDIEDVDENTDNGLYYCGYADRIFYVKDSKVIWVSPGEMEEDVPYTQEYPYELARREEIPTSVNDLSGISAYGKVKYIRIIDDNNDIIDEVEPAARGRVDLRMPIPPAPDEEGEYTLKVSVDANGYSEYSWIKEEIQNGGATL